MRRQDILLGWRERWKQPDVQSIARLLAEELLAEQVPTESPFGEIDGRTDLRGIRLSGVSSTQAQSHERISVRGGDWSGLDLSGAELFAMNWTELRVTDCVFDDADLDQLRCWAVEVSDCSAARTSLRSAQIGSVFGGFARSVWQRVSLRGADVRRMHGDVSLVDLDLSNAKFTQTDFGWSDLTRVHFAGRVNGLTLGSFPVSDRPSHWVLDEVDFSAADPRDLHLIGVDLGAPLVDVRLPDDEDHWVVADWLPFLDRVAASAPIKLTSEVEIWVDSQRKRLGPRQVSGFLSLTDAVAFAGEPFADHLRDSRDVS